MGSKNYGKLVDVAEKDWGIDRTHEILQKLEKEAGQTENPISTGASSDQTQVTPIEFVEKARRVLYGEMFYIDLKRFKEEVLDPMQTGSDVDLQEKYKIDQWKIDYQRRDTERSDEELNSLQQEKVTLSMGGLVAEDFVQVAVVLIVETHFKGSMHSFDTITVLNLVTSVVAFIFKAFVFVQDLQERKKFEKDQMHHEVVFKTSHYHRDTPNFAFFFLWMLTFYFA